MRRNRIISIVVLVNLFVKKGLGVGNWEEEVCGGI